VGGGGGGGGGCGWWVGLSSVCFVGRGGVIVDRGWLVRGGGGGGWGVVWVGVRSWRVSGSTLGGRGGGVFSRPRTAAPRSQGGGWIHHPSRLRMRRLPSAKVEELTVPKDGWGGGGEIKKKKKTLGGAGTLVGGGGGVVGVGGGGGG